MPRLLPTLSAIEGQVTPSPKSLIERGILRIRSISFGERLIVVFLQIALVSGPSSHCFTIDNPTSDVRDTRDTEKFLSSLNESGSNNWGYICLNGRYSLC